MTAKRYYENAFSRQQLALYQTGHTIIDWQPGLDNVPIEDIPAELVKDQFKIRLAGACGIRSDAGLLVQQCLDRELFNNIDRMAFGEIT